jgi:anti-sigma-K factor RskA
MATEHEYWLEQGEIYALGALDGQELNAFEAHLGSGCVVCQACIEETRETLMLMPRSLSTIAPPAAVKARVLERAAPPAAAVNRARRADRRGRSWWMAGTATFAAAAVVLIAYANLKSTRAEIARLNSQLAMLQTESAEKDRLIAFLSAREVRAVELTGLAAAPQATAKLFWNPVTRRGVLITFGLPKPSPDKAYELWAIAGNEPIAAGVFTVDDRGQARFPLPEMTAGTDFDKFAVTLEPAAGMAKPSGPMVLLGSL